MYQYSTVLLLYSTVLYVQNKNRDRDILNEIHIFRSFSSTPKQQKHNNNTDVRFEQVPCFHRRNSHLCLLSEQHTKTNKTCHTDSIFDFVVNVNSHSFLLLLSITSLSQSIHPNTTNTLLEHVTQLLQIRKYNNNNNNKYKCNNVCCAIVVGCYKD